MFRATHGHLASSKKHSIICHTTGCREEPTQAQCDTGATHNYKLILCWTMEAITNYFYGNNSNQEI